MFKTETYFVSFIVWRGDRWQTFVSYEGARKFINEHPDADLDVGRSPIQAGESGTLDNFEQKTDFYLQLRKA